MTKIEIIDETVEYYSNNPRGLKPDSVRDVCVYISIQGDKCAVGRCMTDVAIATWGNYNGTIGNLSHESPLQNNLDIIFQDRYKGHNVDFWRDVQSLHDFSNNWNKQQLTAMGNEALRQLKERYTN